MSGIYEKIRDYPKNIVGGTFFRERSHSDLMVPELTWSGKIRKHHGVSKV